MDTLDPSPPPPKHAGVSTGQLILLFGVVQVLLIYLLLVGESRVGILANRAAATWTGRLVLAGIGLSVITVGMITILSVAERRARRRSRDEGDSSQSGGPS